MYICKLFLQVDNYSREVTLQILQNHSLRRAPMIPFVDKVPFKISPCGSEPVGMPLVLKRLKIYFSTACKTEAS